MPDSIETINENTFKGNSIDILNLGNYSRLAFIGISAFDGNNLTSFILPQPNIVGFQYWVDGNSIQYEPGTTVNDLNTFYEGYFVSTDIDDIPISYDLKQNYPNPFNPFTTINFELPEEGKIDLTIFNIHGQKIKEVINSHLNAGYHTILVNMLEYASGVYLYRLSENDFVQRKKMTLLK